MATVAFEDFLGEVLPESQGASVPAAINAIRNACFDFCRRSHVWNDFVDGETYIAGEPEYMLYAPAGAIIVSVLSVTLDNQRTIYPWVLSDLSATRPDWRTATGVIEGFFQPSPDTVRFIGVPDTNGVFDACLAYAPSRTATGCSSLLIDHYLETIKYGALWKLKAMTDQPWSDPIGAAYYEKEFLMRTNAAVIDRNRGVSGATMRVPFVPFV